MIETVNLSFAYKQKKIIQDITMTAKPGEITAVIGTNGIGKSTLLKNICGILKGTGEVKLCGCRISDYKKSDMVKQISYLSQETVSTALLSVFEVVLLGRITRLSNFVADTELDIVENVIRRLGLEDIASRNIGELSGGQRQLVFIAQALVRNPKILVMDEPTSSLDLYHQFEIMGLIKSLTISEGFTTLITLHQLNLASRFADKIVVLHNGGLYDTGTPTKILTPKTLRDVYRINAEKVEAGGISYVLPVEQYKE
ncbi:ABC transporter ATP-binding protein [Spirochaetia bacterium]|nr:ABC transporter ATP-binding protein [Spirochaetia bacterium]